MIIVSNVFKKNLSLAYTGSDLDDHVTIKHN